MVKVVGPVLREPVRSILREVVSRPILREVVFCLIIREVLSRPILRKVVPYLIIREVLTRPINIGAVV